MKKNRPQLHERPGTPPWPDAALRLYDHTVGHCRKEARVVQVLTVSDLGFPHAAQVERITRHRTTRETVYVITDLTSRQTSPWSIAHLVRSQ